MFVLMFLYVVRYKVGAGAVFITVLGSGCIVMVQLLATMV
jgi:hypothetical protein